MMKRKIKKYDLIVLIDRDSGCSMGDHLVLSVKPENIKLFAVRPRNLIDMQPKQFLKKYEVKFYG